MSLLGLTFTSPLILFSLLSLPLIWWLLRLTPPRPKQEVFPPTPILEEIGQREETPAQSPWWLTLLRLLMAALVIGALAEPVWNAQDKSITGTGPVLIVLDNGWAAGPNWQERAATAEKLLSQAADDSRPTALIFSTDGAKADVTTVRAQQLLEVVKAAQPQPLPVDYTALAERIRESSVGFDTLVWLSSGLAHAGADEFVEAIDGLNIPQIVYYAPATNNLQVLTQINNAPEALVARVERPDIEGSNTGTATAFDQKGRSIASSSFEFTGEDRAAEIRFVLPVELRNEITRIAIDNNGQAGAVQLLDERFRRRRVGLVSGGKADQAQPLLSPLYYISRALNPFSEVREARDANVAQAVPQLIEENVSTMVLADIGTLPDATLEQLEKWVDSGGMLVRFAGPRLASAPDDTLVPVELRRGGRSLGGTLTWGTPQPLTKFEVNSPFEGITVPEDVEVTRQVLAEPDIDLIEKTWASLADGTPLVTASQRGQGWIVLFHVTADASWSNLPLSGVFVDMLRRIVAVSNGAIAADKTRSTTAASAGPAVEEETESVALPPLSMIDGFGSLTAPATTVRPLQIGAQSTIQISADNPPGTYGTSDAYVAINLFSEPADLSLIDSAKLPASTQKGSYQTESDFELKSWLLAAAILLLALDCLAVLWMAGALRRIPQFAAVLLVGGLTIAVAVAIPLHRAQAQESTGAAAPAAAIDFEDTLRTRLAYVITGDAQLDSLSKKGLTGLTNFIASRTSLEPGQPVGVDISKDELAFYPLLYWPITTMGTVPDDKTMARVDAFMKSGGSVLFDTRDQLQGGFGSRRISSETQRLREILLSLDIPPLEPVPDDHVLTRAFYLLSVFPGRYLEGKLWVETSEAREADAVDRPTRQGDGVSSILITSNDMAGAWAIEADGSASLPVVPPNPTQRTYAYRTGVNIVMYTLTGNYKSDQVHIPALLERLGQ
ncbi:MAG: DUF4159 domain-containing protein [Rhizobiaceae bacterium]|nr:DUF4159 domain-containing protein [Rhizobiaceae bacterium]